MLLVDLVTDGRLWEVIDLMLLIKSVGGKPTD